MLFSVSTICPGGDRFCLHPVQYQLFYNNTIYFTLVSLRVDHNILQEIVYLLFITRFLSTDRSLKLYSLTYRILAARCVLTIYFVTVFESFCSIQFQDELDIYLAINL